MSVDLGVSFPSARLVSSTQWQRVIDSLGFAFLLDHVDWTSQSGFLPVRHGGVVTGFELHFDDITAFLAGTNMQAPKSHDILLMFRFGGDMLECKAAMCAASALAHATDGIFHDPQSGESFDAASAIAQTRETLASE